MGEYLDWITGLVTLVGVWLTGKKKWQGQAVQFLAQGFWLALIAQRRLWGLIPLEVCLIYLYGKNTLDWFREERGGRAVGLSSLWRGIFK